MISDWFYPNPQTLFNQIPTLKEFVFWWVGGCVPPEQTISRWEWTLVQEILGWKFEMETLVVEP